MTVIFSTEEPTFRRLSSSRRELLEELEVTVDGIRIVIPAGFTSDFSSIPALPLARLLINWRKVDLAGLVHDWLYKAGDLSRKQADQVWRKVARAGETHAGPLAAWLGYLGLRVGGWVTWRRYRRAG